jgi:carboxyl-terminal processing protease
MSQLLSQCDRNPFPRRLLYGLSPVFSVFIFAPALAAPVEVSPGQITPPPTRLSQASPIWLGQAPDPRRSSLKNSPKAVVDEVWQFVDQYYIDGKFNRLNWASIRTSLLARNYTSSETAYGAIRETLAQLQDPYTRFLEPREYSQLASKTVGEQRGIGIELTSNPNGNNLRVSRIEANSVAAKAGVRLGDVVLSINGRSTEGLTVERAAQLLKGSAGMPVVLTISRGTEKPQSFKIVRDGPIEQTVRYELKSVAGAQVGYIRLTGFNSGSTQQMADAIAALQKQSVRGLILDLRDNPGGLLDAGINITRHFLPSGIVVQTLERRGKFQSIRANNSALTNLPLVVLVNRESASASEIVAGALQDNRRATIVGTRTFGKAMVQALHELADGSAVVVTVAHYYTPRGTDISTKGITPDIQLPVNPSQDFILRTSPQLWGSSRDERFTAALNVLARQIRTPASGFPPPANPSANPSTPRTGGKSDLLR